MANIPKREDGMLDEISRLLHMNRYILDQLNRMAGRPDAALRGEVDNLIRHLQVSREEVLSGGHPR